MIFRACLFLIATFCIFYISFFCFKELCGINSKARVLFPWFAHKNKGLELTKETVIGRFVTARLEVDYKKPSPMQEEITVISRVEEIGERKVIINMEMHVAGDVRATARMVAVGVKDNM